MPASPSPRAPAATAARHARLILASASPRRHDLLRRAGVPFEAEPADLDESAREGESAPDTLCRLAREKAAHVAARRAEPGRLVLGADTGVVLGETLFGKPRDADHAVELLSQLVGHTHRVITAVALVASGGEGDASRVWECAVTSRVTLRPAGREELVDYVASGEPLDKAGAYALQGEGRRFVTRVEGSESNVIGLPLEETLALIERARRERPEPSRASRSAAK